MSCCTKITYIEQLNMWIQSNPNEEFKEKKHVIKLKIKERKKLKSQN